MYLDRCLSGLARFTLSLFQQQPKLCVEGRKRAEVFVGEEFDRAVLGHKLADSEAHRGGTACLLSKFYVSPIAKKGDSSLHLATPENPDHPISSPN